MESNVAEQKSGMVWLSIAGPVAILLVFALYTVNNRLTESTGEKVLGDTLRELRGAQTSIQSHYSDVRSTNEGMHAGAVIGDTYEQTSLRAEKN